MRVRVLAISGIQGRLSLAAPRFPLAITVAVLLLAGCAGIPPDPTPDRHAPAEHADPIAEPATPDVYWWYVRFRMTWPEDAEPPWYPDLWIAERVLGPILAAEADTIELWRFHRRAARDSAGGLFSFIFQATPQTAARINQRIRNDAEVRKLKRQRVLERVVYDDPASPQRPEIADTSDTAWSPEMQEAWPLVIMGVSRFWLELIRRVSDSDDWPEDPAERYAAVSDAIDRHWKNEGGHALLHHMNAVFGYREVDVLRRESFRF